MDKEARIKEIEAIVAMFKEVHKRRPNITEVAGKMSDFNGGENAASSLSGWLRDNEITPETLGISASRGRPSKKTHASEKGSPADCLETIKMNESLFKNATNKDIGVKVGEVAGLRPYHPSTIYKEFKILKDLGIFVPVEGRRGYYRFSDMMVGEDENYTKTLINAINDIRYQVGKRGEERPLHRWGVAQDRLPVVKELIKMTVLDQIRRMQNPALPEGKVVWHILENELLAPGQESALAKVNKLSMSSDASERIWILKRGETIETAMVAIRQSCPNAVFDVALSDVEHISRIPKNESIKMLVFQGGVSDFAQLGGVVEALRALYLKKEDIVPMLLRIYSVMNGKAYDRGLPPPEAFDDPAKFALSFIFDLPPIKAIPAEDQPKMNKMLFRLLTAA